jgi:uncharacterized RDD family membrane protein YckC
MTKREDKPAELAPVKYATFNSRIIATAIDLFCVMPFAIPLIGLATDALFGPMNINELSTKMNQPELIQNPAKAIMVFLGLARQYHMLERALLDNALQVACIAAFTLPFWFRYSATPGKLFLRLEIQDAQTGARMTRKQAIKRFLSYAVSFIPLTFGFLWVLFNKKRQGFHDKIAGTVVIIKPKKIDKDTI